MKLDSLTPAKGSRRNRKRIGRGPGSGTGKTAGRGHKGQKSRSGYSRRLGFEGGQMPLIRRVPKRGFTNIFATEIAIVNVSELDRFPEGTIVNPEMLVQEGCIKKVLGGVKILGNGDLTKKLVVQAQAFSAGARSKIEAAGGSVEVINLKPSAPSTTSKEAPKESNE